MRNRCLVCSDLEKRLVNRKLEVLLIVVAVGVPVGLHPCNLRTPWGRGLKSRNNHEFGTDHVKETHRVDRPMYCLSRQFISIKQ